MIQLGKKRKTDSSSPFGVVKVEKERDLESISDDHMKQLVLTLQMPMALKKILVDDWRHITSTIHWHVLPRKVSVSGILKAFLDHEALNAKPAADEEVLSTSVLSIGRFRFVLCQFRGIR